MFPPVVVTGVYRQLEAEQQSLLHSEQPIKKSHTKHAPITPTALIHECWQSTSHLPSVNAPGNKKAHNMTISQQQVLLPTAVPHQ